MPIQTIEPRRLYRQIADQLRLLIEAGEFPVGARLPPERDLALKLGVSRPSVREALIALEVEGWVEVRMGSGVYVQSPGGAPRASLTAESPLETIRARRTIESELAAQAALNPVPALVEGLRATLSGDVAALQRHYTPRLAGTAQEWTLTLTPREPGIAALVAAIRLAGRESQVLRFEVDEAGGDTSVMVIEGRP